MDPIATARRLVKAYPEVLAPNDVIIEARSLGFDSKTIGTSLKGHSIELYSVGYGPNVLLYGFPDPGEALGATGILCLMKALKDGDEALTSLPYRWNFIPCLNHDDQPDQGRSLMQVMKTSDEEVDWLVHRPRPETSAILETGSLLAPVLSFPLHDEYHCGEEVPTYMPVSERLSPQLCDDLRSILASFKIPLSSDIRDEAMGEGFLYMPEVPDIANSTFDRLSKTGLVAICEVADIVGLPESELIGAQLSFVLRLMSTKASPGAAERGRSQT